MRGRRLIVRNLFQLLYGPGAHHYDRITEVLFAGEWRRWQLAAVAAVPPGGTVVELGAGTGALGELVADRFDVWLGVERSSQMIAVARRRNRPPRLIFVRADATALPLPAEFADVLIATFPTTFILDPNVQREARRIVKPAGRLVIVLSGELKPQGLRRRFACAVMALAYGRRRSSIDAPIDLPGFDGVWSWLDTDFGKALVFVGSPAVSPDAGCSRPPAVAGGLGPRRRPG